MIPCLLLLALAFAPDGQDGAPDPVFFEDVVQPLLLRSCSFAGCHGDPGAGRLFLVKPDFTGRMSADATAANLATVSQFVKFQAPLESRLVLKPLVKKDGGLPHSGGTQYQFKKDSEAFKIFADWINGVELANVPPIADPGADVGGKVGQTIALDGGASRDRRGLPLEFRWSVSSAPEGAHPVLEDGGGPTPRFKGDVEGAYQVSLVVSNGKSESEPRAVTVELDSLPCVRLDAERASEMEGFFVENDPSANGGKALGVSQEATPAAPARARFELMLPESGAYRIFARVRSVAAGKPAPLTFAIDDAPAAAIEGAPTQAWQFLPVSLAAAARELQSARLDAAGATVRSGAASVEGGVLVLNGSPSRPARVDFDSVATGATGATGASGGSAVDAGRLSARVQLTRPRPREAHVAGAWLLFHVRGERDFDFAGAEPGRSRFVIGRFESGVAPVRAESRRPFRPGSPIALDVEFTAAGAILYCGDGDLLEARLPSAASGDVGVSAVGTVRVDDVVLASGGKELLKRDFATDGAPAGSLAAGSHVLEIRADSTAAPSIDELFVFRADLAEGGDDAKRRAVRSIYLDLLGRPPLPIESLMAASEDEPQLVRRLVGSLEFFETWYEDELYYFLLLDNFRPRTPALEALPARLANGALDVRGAIQEIVISQAFNLRNPGNDTFVTVVLEQLLGITVQEQPKILEAGKKMYDGYKSTLFGRAGDKQSDIVTIVIDQDGFAPIFLARTYRRYLRTEPEKADLERWSAQLRQDPRAFDAIVTEWFDSERYRVSRATPRAKTDFAWIRGLFVDLLERKPTFDEFRNFRNALQALSDSTPIRSVLAKVMLDSGKVPLPKPGLSDAEAAAWVTATFRRLLARTPTSAEVSAFSAALKEPSGGPAVVMHAIVCSPEYQGY